MKTQDILNLDYRTKENKEIIQKVLTKIKPLSKYSGEDIPIEAVEKLLSVLIVKYAVSIQQISISFIDSKSFNYMAGIINDENYSFMGYCYGLTMYELLSKIAIKIYSDVKTGKLITRAEKETA